jgi:TrmH family RNA methyltransferase
MQPNKITSLTNSKIKSVVQLRNRKQRAATGLTIVEGRREITRALEAGVTFKELYTCRDLLGDAKAAEVSAMTKAPVYETTRPVFTKISYGERNDGILAVCAPQQLFFRDLRSPTNPLFVIVESVEKPGNLGAILRTCDGAGVDGVIICDEQTDLYNPNVIRASLGTVFSVKVVVSTNEETLEFLKSKNVTICATLPQARAVYTSEKLTDAIAIVVGSEQDGLTDFWTRQADVKVKIPMKGYADSLNVSASTAILLYEIVRQRTI